MEVPDVRVQTLDKQELSLKRDLSQIVEALRQDGCLLLKKATKVATFESNFLRTGILLNRAVKVILFAAESDEYRFSKYLVFQSSNDPRKPGRDSAWEEIAQRDKLTAISCMHLGADESVPWTIDVFEDYRTKAPKKSVKVRASGGDIFICTTALKRGTPFLNLDKLQTASIVMVSYVLDAYTAPAVMVRPPKVTVDSPKHLAEEVMVRNKQNIWKRTTQSASSRKETPSTALANFAESPSIASTEPTQATEEDHRYSA